MCVVCFYIHKMIAHCKYACSTKMELYRVKTAKSWRNTMKLLLDYIETSYHVISVVVVAEVMKRICRVFYEYILYSNYYEIEGKLLTIIKRSFGMSLCTSIALITYLFVTTVFVINRSSWPSMNYFKFMPLYWLFTYLGISDSYLYYADWIRESHGLDYAEGMASNYFHGYLKLILPAQTGDNGIKERMELYENHHKIRFAIKSLFILVPNTMFINSKIESKILKKDGVMPLETIIKHRAGVARPFKTDVYRFTIPINESYYYVAVEGATPMLSFFDALNFQPSTTWQMKEMRREIYLKFYKHLKYLLNKWPETQGKAELVLYNSYKSDGRPQDVGEVLLAYITNMWNKGEAELST